MSGLKQMVFIQLLSCLIYLRRTCLFIPVTWRILKRWFIIFTLFLIVPIWRRIVRLLNPKSLSAISAVLPRPVDNNHHQSSLLLLSVDKSTPNLPFTSISCPLSSDITPAPPQAAEPIKHIPVNNTNSDYFFV